MRLRGCNSLIIATCLLTSCARPLITTAPDWKGRKAGCYTLAIAFVPNKPYLSDPAMFEKFFGPENPAAGFREVLAGAFRELAFRHSACKKILILDDSLALNATSLPIRRGISRYFKVPEGPATALHDRGVDFLLLIEDYSMTFADRYESPDNGLTDQYGRARPVTAQSRMEEVKIYRHHQLRQSFRFALIPCTTGVPVYYGEIDNSGTFASLTVREWQNCIVDGLKTMFKKSPIPPDEN